MGSAIAGLALFGALTACAERPAEVGFGGQPPSAPPSGAPPSGAPVDPMPSQENPSSVRRVHPAWPDPPPAGVPVPAQQLDTLALPPGYPRRVWTEAAGWTVGAVGQEGGCTRVHSELREQTPQLVRIAFVEVAMSPGPCTMDLRFRPLTVHLDAPLGERTVVLMRS